MVSSVGNAMGKSLRVSRAAGQSWLLPPVVIGIVSLPLLPPKNEMLVIGIQIIAPSCLSHTRRDLWLECALKSPKGTEEQCAHLVPLPTREQSVG